MSFTPDSFKFLSFTMVYAYFVFAFTERPSTSMSLNSINIYFSPPNFLHDAGNCDEGLLHTLIVAVALFSILVVGTKTRKL